MERHFSFSEICFSFCSAKIYQLRISLKACDKVSNEFVLISAIYFRQTRPFFESAIMLKVANEPFTGITPMAMRQLRADRNGTKRCVRQTSELWTRVMCEMCEMCA